MISDGPAPLLRVLLEALRAHRRVTFVLTNDLANHHGLTNIEAGVVFLDEANDLGEMRSTVVHELNHLVCPECPDEEIEGMTARMLVPLEDALRAYTSGDFTGTADRLVVDRKLVRARLREADAMPSHTAEAG